MSDSKSVTAISEIVITWVRQKPGGKNQSERDWFSVRQKSKWENVILTNLSESIEWGKNQKEAKTKVRESESTEWGKNQVREVGSESGCEGNNEIFTSILLFLATGKSGESILLLWFYI